MSVRAPTSQIELLEKLQEVLDLANTQRVTSLNRQQRGSEEYWDPGQIEAEAEQHAFTCRSLLKSLYGLDSDLVFCRRVDAPTSASARPTPSSAHLICVRDGWALDSRSAWVVRRDALPYTWIAVCRPDGIWHPILHNRQGLQAPGKR